MQKHIALGLIATQALDLWEAHCEAWEDPIPVHEVGDLIAAHERSEWEALALLMRGYTTLTMVQLEAEFKARVDLRWLHFSCVGQAVGELVDAEDRLRCSGQLPESEHDPYYC